VNHKRFSENSEGNIGQRINRLYPLSFLKKREEKEDRVERKAIKSNISLGNKGEPMGTEMIANNHWIVNGQVGICNEVCMKQEELISAYVFMFKEVVLKEWSSSKHPASTLRGKISVKTHQVSLNSFDEYQHRRVGKPASYAGVLDT
jgi:hypothetical protein